MEVRTLSAAVERFTIAIEPAGKTAGVLTMIWDTTQASIPIRVEK